MNPISCQRKNKSARLLLTILVSEKKRKGRLVNLFEARILLSFNFFSLVYIEKYVEKWKDLKDEKWKF